MQSLPVQAMSLRWYQEKYAQPGEVLPCDTHRRVAQALAQVEPVQLRGRWAQRFESALRSGLLPGGRIMAGVGVEPAAGAYRPTLMNCFVLPAEPESELPRRLRATLRAGGGVGVDYSDLAGGVMLALERSEAVARSIEHPPRGCRRAAQMAVLRADHPEIEAFIAASPSSHPHLTRAVAVDDGFMQAAHRDPNGAASARLRAIAQAAWAGGEPGLLFTSRVQADDNLGARETLHATNPCGEQPLPPFGACALASIDLTRVVQGPFAPQARVSWGLLASLVHVGVRALDNALDITHWPLPQQAREMHATRRIGLGITGLGDALALLNRSYSAPQGREVAAQLMRFIAHAAYRASVRLARERGPYPTFEASAVLQLPRYAARLPADLRQAIRRHGLRHSHLLAIAPAASISVAFGDNVSSGLEPITAAQWQRRWQDPEGRTCSAWVQSHAHRLWMSIRGLADEPAQGWDWQERVSPEAQLAMVAALAPHVDGAISKTLSVPQATTPEDIQALLQTAWRLGLKGISVFRRGSRPGVLVS
ncbi:MAG: ribonucleoside-diphosphate reductase, adenosylcobalamin-dependent [Betaproteobacteria bacterium]|nr:ribonucleoside-diphosphate reductase, adenosylcobalamin-dependent [Betaproteobacteria bacterium]